MILIKQLLKKGESLSNIAFSPKYGPVIQKMALRRIKLKAKTIHNQPIHKKVLKQLIGEGVVVEYYDHSTSMRVYGLKPEYRRLLLNKNPITLIGITKEEVKKPIKYRR